MQYYFAPLEGITGYLYRNTHHQFFGGVDKYFMPFAAPNYTRNFKRKEKADMAPENNKGLYAVPQILSNNADETLWAVDEMLALGYREINLNLGCPMPTVAKKKKGSGFLKYTKELDAYLDAVYEGIAARNGRLSVKTRLGTDSTEEAEELIEIYNRYPISELIIHPRCQKDLYRGKPDREAFERVLSMSRNPVVYNGDLCTPADAAEARQRWGNIPLMMGRGLLANPALVRQCQGGPAISAAELAAFHEALYRGYQEILPGTHVLLNHMKELWFYMGQLFTVPRLAATGAAEAAGALSAGQDAAKLIKQIRKASTAAQYEAAVHILLSNCPILT